MLLLAINLKGQDENERFGREIDRGAKLLEQGEYAEADKIFREVIKNMKVLPTNISYYFGKNSFYLEKYKQSINWLSKYMELSGTKGRFFDDAVLHFEKAQELYSVQREAELQYILDELSQETEIDCQDQDKVICPVCKGESVIIKEGKFGQEYITCPYSNQRGLLTCQEYNLLIKGELKPKTDR